MCEIECIHIYLNIHTHIYIYTYIYIYIHTHIYILTYIPGARWTRETHTSSLNRPYTLSRTYRAQQSSHRKIHIHTHTYIYTYIHTYIYTHTHLALDGQEEFTRHHQIDGIARVRLIEHSYHFVCPQQPFVFQLPLLFDIQSSYIYVPSIPLACHLV